MAHGKQIHLALAEYAIDHNGEFPTATTNSNAAFRQLFDSKFQYERIFWVTGSAWHDTLPRGTIKPDNDVGAPPNYELGLEQGENHYAYVSGYNIESKGNAPLIADGFGPTLGTYTKDPDQRGGVWKRKSAIVVRVDGSGKLEKPNRDGRVYEKDDYGRDVDIFSKAYLGEGATILNPW